MRHMYIGAFEHHILFLIQTLNTYIFFTDKRDKLYTSRRQLSYPIGAYRAGLIGYILYTRLKYELSFSLSLPFSLSLYIIYML